MSRLKDRFGTQVRTHYPETLGDEIAIMDQEARTPAGHGQIPVRVPPFLKEVLAALTAELRGSPQVNQRSGVSVRYSIGNLERVAASALRRAARTGEPEAVPRLVDLPPVLAGSMGRVEFDSIEEGREEEILLRAFRSAVLEVFRRRLAGLPRSISSENVLATTVPSGNRQPRGAPGAGCGYSTVSNSICASPGRAM